MTKLEDSVDSFWFDFIQEGPKENAFGPYFVSRYLKKNEGEIVARSPRSRDFGIDCWDFSDDKTLLKIFQAKYSESPALVATSLTVFAQKSMPFLFGDSIKINAAQEVSKLKSIINDNIKRIKRVEFIVISKLPRDKIESSETYKKEKVKLLSEIDNNTAIKKYNIVVDILSLSPEDLPSELPPLAEYPLSCKDTPIISHRDHELRILLIPLFDLIKLYELRGMSLFAKNVRYFLGDKNEVSEKIQETLTKIAIKKELAPSIFTFYHLGITISCQEVTKTDGTLKLIDPYILNGCQTVMTASNFYKNNPDKIDNDIFKDIKVVGRIIQSSDPNFINNVTISNNRQNEIEAADLRANDDTQKFWEKKFSELKIYYERQKKSYANRQQKEKDFSERYINTVKPIEIRKMAQLICAINGKIQMTSNINRIFETDTEYYETFKNENVENPLLLVFAYKVHLALRKELGDLAYEHPKKYGFGINAYYLALYLTIHLILKKKRDLQSISETTSLTNEFRSLVNTYLKQALDIIDGCIDRELDEYINRPQNYFRRDSFVKKCKSAFETQYGIKLLAIEKLDFDSYRG